MSRGEPVRLNGLAVIPFVLAVMLSRKSGRRDGRVHV